MKLSQLLKEIEKYSAIAKDSGKTVYFKSKKGKDAAIKAGTHSELKPKKVDNKSDGGKKISANSFKTSAEKNNKPTIGKKEIEDVDLFNYHKQFLKQIYSDLNVADINKMKAQQSVYNEKITSNRDFAESLSMWQEWSSNSDRKKMDKMLIDNPPPPIKTDKNLWRGMILEPKKYDKFIQMISSGKEFKLPPSSFTPEPITAFTFTGMGQQDRNKKLRSMIIKLKNDCGQFNGYYVAPTKNTATIFSGEEEILTQSNSKYSVDSIEELKFKKDRGNLTVLTLTQKCGKINEGENDIVDFSNSDFMYSVLGPTQRVKK